MLILLSSFEGLIVQGRWIGFLSDSSCRSSCPVVEAFDETNRVLKRRSLSLLGILKWAMQIKVKCFCEIYWGVTKLSIKPDVDVVCMADEAAPAFTRIAGLYVLMDGRWFLSKAFHIWILTNVLTAVDASEKSQFKHGLCSHSFGLGSHMTASLQYENKSSVSEGTQKRIMLMDKFPCSHELNMAGAQQPADAAFSPSPVWTSFHTCENRLFSWIGLVSLDAFLGRPTNSWSQCVLRSSVIALLCQCASSPSICFTSCIFQNTKRFISKKQINEIVQKKTKQHRRLSSLVFFDKTLIRQDLIIFFFLYLLTESTEDKSIKNKMKVATFILKGGKKSEEANFFCGSSLSWELPLFSVSVFICLSQIASPFGTNCRGSYCGTRPHTSSCCWTWCTCWSQIRGAWLVKL